MTDQANARVCATTPPPAISRVFRSDRVVVDCRDRDVGAAGGGYFGAGAGTVLHLYERPSSTVEQRLAVCLVADFEAVRGGLRARDVSFEDDDLPALKTENGLIWDPSGFVGNWTRDPDGHVLGHAEPS